MKLKLMIARFPYKRAEDPDIADWFAETIVKAKADPRIETVLRWKKDDTPITMTRNLCVQQAREFGADILIMIDSDMKPDAYLASSVDRLGFDPNAKPFFDSSLDFLLNHQGPCVVGAPYCGPPPHENVYVFRWGRRQSDHPNVDLVLEQYSREEAAARAGFEEAAALPTGLIMMHVRAFDAMEPPYFTYEWKDKTQSVKASTEDVVLTRDLSIAGVPQYVNWDAWAGHWKMKCVGKPCLLSVSDVRKGFADAVKRNQPTNERLIMVNEGEPESVNGHGKPARKRQRVK